MYMQNVMLLARAAGLDTCAQEARSVWYRTVDEFLGVPPELMLFSGMASATAIRTRRSTGCAPTGPRSRSTRLHRLLTAQRGLVGKTGQSPIR